MPFPYPKIIVARAMVPNPRQINCRETALPCPHISTASIYAIANTQI